MYIVYRYTVATLCMRVNKKQLLKSYTGTDGKLKRINGRDNYVIIIIMNMNCMSQNVPPNVHNIKVE